MSEAKEKRLFVVNIEDGTNVMGERILTERLVRAESAAKALAQVATARVATADDVERLMKAE